MILGEYKIFKDIGKGRYSRIYKEQSLKKYQIVPIKKIFKNYFDEPDYDLKCSNREIQMTLDCQSSNVIKLYNSYETEDCFF